MLAEERVGLRCGEGGEEEGLPIELAPPIQGPQSDTREVHSVRLSWLEVQVSKYVLGEGGRGSQLNQTTRGISTHMTCTHTHTHTHQEVLPVLHKEDIQLVHNDHFNGGEEIVVASLLSAEETTPHPVHACQCSTHPSTPRMVLRPRGDAMMMSQL